MKKLIVILLFAFIKVNTYSQDEGVYPVGPVKYTDINNPGNQPKTLKELLTWWEQKDSLLLGWHWCAGKTFGKALMMNSGHIDDKPTVIPFNEEDNTNYPNWYQLNWSPTYINVIRMNSSNNGRPAYSSRNTDEAWLNAQALQFDPLIVYPPNPESLIWDENYNSPFGFKYHGDGIDYNYSDNTYNKTNKKIKLTPEIVPQNGSLKILDESWPNGYRVVDMGYLEYKDKISNNFNGTEWYVSINLRRIDDATMNGDDILKIELEYQDGLIIFTGELPQFNENSEKFIFNANDYIYLGTANGNKEDNKIVIKRNMLPPSNDPKNPNITLSTIFITDYAEIYKKSDITLSSKNKKISNKKLNIKLTYFGKCSIAIDWIRIETPNARNLFIGQYDDEIKSLIQDDLDHFNKTPYTDKDTFESEVGTADRRLIRFYTIDEGNPAYWAAQRYFNKLADSLGTAAEVQPFYNLYENYVKPSNYWLELCKMEPQAATPYIRFGYNSRQINYSDGWKTIGLRNGFYGDLPPSTNNKDTSNSYYETFIWNHTDNPFTHLTEVYNNSQLNQQEKFEAFYNYLWENWSFQAWWEHRKIFEIFVKFNEFILNNYQPVKSGSGFQFSNIPWWSQVFIGSVWGFQDFTDAYLSTIRPPTGEELRLSVWTSIIMGAKGLIYEREYTDPVITHPVSSSDATMTGIGSYNYDGCLKPSQNLVGYDYESCGGSGDKLRDLSAENFLKCDDVGTDFILNQKDFTNLYGFNLNNKAEVVGIENNRFYLGRKSLRMELYKIHTWIKEVDNTLMNLELISWYGKGFYRFTNTRSGYNPDIISTYINRIVTRPVGREKFYKVGENKFQFRPHFEQENEIHVDSGFYDITLLKDKNINLEDKFYLGIVNRRTDPLFYFTTPTQPYRSYMKFLTTDEFYNLAKDGGNDPIDNNIHLEGYQWSNYWWKRCGAREINIPFKFENFETQGQGDWFDFWGYKLVINELGTFNHGWDEPPYYDRIIDRTIDGRATLTMKLLPGEGKILSIRPKKYFIKRYGNLPYSNQSKLISYPILDSNGVETDSMRLHLVYFKPLYGVCDTNKYGVYYNRSTPISKTQPDTNIVWEDSILVSRQIVDCQSQWEYDTMSCDYPSIVVRKDANNVLKAYIVYTCNDLVSPTILGDVVLSTLEVNHESSLQVEGSLQSHAISEYYGRDRDSARFPAEWGTPVINASSQGNFIAWSDSLYGIQTAFNPINSNCIINGPTIKWHDDSAFAQHPSFNVYSSIDKSENNCSLVWQEKKSGAEHSINPEEKNFQIYLTRLNTNSLNDSVFYTLPTQFTISRFSAETNQNSTIVKLSDTDQGRNNIIPVIIRDLKNYNTDPNDSLINLGINNRIDKVVWESQPEDRVGTVYLTSRSIGLTDSSNQYKNWRIYPIQKIKSKGTSIGSPNLFQSQSILLTDVFEYPGGDIIMNFNYSGSSTTTVSQLPINFTSQMTDGDYYFNPLRNLTRQIKSGTQPHLALMPHPITNEDELWRNRRIYEKGGCGKVKDILLNDQFFYNQTPYDIEPDGYVGFKGNQSIYCINVPSKDENIIPLNLPYQEITLSGYESHYEPKLRDTIYTEYFSVGEIDTINFRFFGFDTTYVKMYIQKQGSSSFTQVTLPPGEANDTNARYMLLRLIEGNESNFRLAFVNLDTNFTSYYEYLNIGLLPITDTIVVTVDLVGFQNSRTYVEDKQNIINEKIKLLVVPNPANDIVNITAIIKDSDKIKEKLTIRIFSSIGTEIYQQKVYSGQTITFPVKQYQSGIYFVKADNIDNPFGLRMSSVEGLVIKK